MIFLLTASIAVGACDRQSAPAPQGAENQALPTNVLAPTPTPARARTGVDRSHSGKPWSSTKFEAPNGDQVTLETFKGRPVLVNLWATWCAPCIKELPSIEALARREAERLQVLAISQDLGGRTAVDSWWKKQRFTLLQPYIDAKADFSFALSGDGALPVTIFYGASGKEIWRVTGPMEWDGDEAKALLKEGFKES